jgi:peptide/nickel transport system substrate-binding protein
MAADPLCLDPHSISSDTEDFGAPAVRQFDLFGQERDAQPVAGDHLGHLAGWKDVHGLLYVLAQRWLGLESPKAIQTNAPAHLCANPVGSGPNSSQWLEIFHSLP